MLRLFGQYSLNKIHIKRAYSSAKLKKDTDELIQKLLGRALDYKQELHKHVISSPKHRIIASSLNSLDSTIAEIQMKRKQLDELFDINQKPDLVSLEVLSNGTTHIRPSVFIRTPFSAYLFNCPEGTSRFIASLRIRPQSIQDFFITRSNWDSFGGLFGVLLAKESADHITHLHGPSNLKHFLECVRPFADSDFKNVTKQAFKVQERTSHDEKYEDNAMTVYYIPVFLMTLNSQGDNLRKSCDVAYLLELKEPNKRIDITKVLKKKVPKGPMIGKLKAGETVMLEDGTRVAPEEVYAEDSKDACPNILVVECDQIEKLDSLTTNSNLQKYMNGQRQMGCVVHLTADEILNQEKYQSWMKSFGSECLHLIANGTGEALPLTDGIYRQQKLLGGICPELFPPIFLQDFCGTITQSVEPPTTNVVYAKPFQKYPMRTTRASQFNETPSLTVDDSELAERVIENEAIPSGN
ncbi:Ribonuclease Z [Aphelenchoides bicaudatus]|nr:Ribonuclease Z [Aphelenchoides bicaudatus]